MVIKSVKVNKKLKMFIDNLHVRMVPDQQAQAQELVQEQEQELVQEEEQELVQEQVQARELEQV